MASWRLRRVRQANEAFLRYPDRGIIIFSVDSLWPDTVVPEKMKLDEAQLTLPPQQVTLDVLLEKYAKSGETSADQVRRRVARALAAVERDPDSWEPLFYEALTSGFIPGGRVNSAAGTELQATLINCFVQPVGDS